MFVIIIFFNSAKFMPSMKCVTQQKIQRYIPIHIKSCVLHAKSHVSLPSYYGSTCQRMTPVIPRGLTLATLEHSLQSYTLPIQPRKMPEPNGVNSVWSKVMMTMMVTTTMISSTINRPSIIATQLMKVMTPFLIFPTRIMTSMTTCHQICLYQEDEQTNFLPEGQGDSESEREGGSDEETDSSPERDVEFDEETDSASESADGSGVVARGSISDGSGIGASRWGCVDPLTPIQALPFLQMMKQHSALPHSYPRSRPILSNLSL